MSKLALLILAAIAALVLAVFLVMAAMQPEAVEMHRAAQLLAADETALARVEVARSPEL